MPELAASSSACYTTSMKDRVTIGSRGTITIPARLRQEFGWKPHDELVIEPNNGGILLRPVGEESIELYTEDRIAEFASEEEAVGAVVPRSN